MVVALYRLPSTIAAPPTAVWDLQPTLAVLACVHGEQLLVGHGGRRHERSQSLGGVGHLPREVLGYLEAGLVITSCCVVSALFTLAAVIANAAGAEDGRAIIVGAVRAAATGFHEVQRVRSLQTGRRWEARERCLRRTAYGERPAGHGVACESGMKGKRLARERGVNRERVKRAAVLLREAAEEGLRRGRTQRSVKAEVVMDSLEIGSDEARGADGLRGCTSQSVEAQVVVRRREARGLHICKSQQGIDSRRVTTLLAEQRRSESGTVSLTEAALVRWG